MPTRTPSRTGRHARFSRTPPTSARSRSPRSAWVRRGCSAGSRRSASAVARASTCLASCLARVLPDDKWYGTAILNVPIGEGIAVTPLQMAALYASVANGGDVDPAARDGRDWHEARHDLVLAPARHDARRARVAHHADRQVVDYGTGMLAQIKGYTVAGKTGTTPKYDAKHGTYCDPYKGHCEYQTSFVGFAPAKHPRFVALVMVDSPQSKNPYDIEGGYVAAPAFKSIAPGHPAGAPGQARFFFSRPGRGASDLGTSAPVELAALCMAPPDVASRVIGATDRRRRRRHRLPFGALPGRARSFAACWSAMPTATTSLLPPLPTAPSRCSSSASCPSSTSRRSVPRRRARRHGAAGGRALRSSEPRARRSWASPGTNGKTTTTLLPAAILDAAQRPSGLLGTVERRIGGQRKAAGLTTPEAPDLQRPPRSMIEAGDEACVDGGIVDRDRAAAGS